MRITYTEPPLLLFRLRADPDTVRYLWRRAHHLFPRDTARRIGFVKRVLELGSILEQDPSDVFQQLVKLTLTDREPPRRIASL